MRRPRHLILCALAAVAVLLTGCSKVTSENYEKIQTGMTLSQVEDILGKGTEQSGAGLAIGNVGASAKVVTWGDDKKSITITFTNDKVVLKVKKNI